jgi:iron complex outermembrane receptor protein
MKKLLLAIFSIALTAMSYGQDVTVSGKVTDGNGNPLSGAIIVQKGTSNGSKSKSDGSFSITIPAKSIPTSVMARMISFGSAEITVDGSSNDVTFNAVLGEQAKSLNEVVVSASKKSEKIINSPASVSVLSEARIQQNTTLSVVDNVKKIAAVDVMPTGIVSNNVVVRGFNNIFSGATMFLVDNRLASVPSIRVNAFHLVPTSNTDIRSMEIVRGPSSALYGPFASNGVMAVYTKSPLDMENRMEITTGITTGLRAGDEDNAKFGFKANNSIENLGILNPEIRIAGKLSKNLGVKVSGNFMSGSDFAFFDDREPSGRSVRFGNQSGGNTWTSDGSAADTFRRNFGIRKTAIDARIDYRADNGMEFIFSGGYSSNTNMELTGLGAAQAVGWTTNYFQAQFKKDRLYAQYFVNSTNSGNTFLIPQSATGNQFTYLKETSSMHSFQLQHSSKVSNNTSLVYGFDAFLTRPSGNVYGRFDGGLANINQYGGYLQADHKFNKKWSTVLAARLDYQDVIKEYMFSPRGAVVFKPKENHTFRLTYNRAFQAPTALNFFLDLNNGNITGSRNSSLSSGATTVPNSIRALGNTGLTYGAGTNGLPTVLTPTGASLSYEQASNAANIPTVLGGMRNVFIGQFRAAGAPLSSATATANLLLNGMTPTSLAPVDLVAGKAVDVSTINNKSAVASTITQTAELGYKGMVTDKLSLGFDLYYTRINDFVGPLTTASYQVAIDPSYYAQSSTQAQMLANINSLPAAQRIQVLGGLTGLTNPTQIAALSNADIIKAYTTTLVRAGALANTGTIAPNNSGYGSDVVLTYSNLGTVDVAGADLSFNYLATKDLTIEGAFSFVNKDRIALLGAAEGFVSLNAPKYKSALNFAYRLPIDKNSLTLNAGWRWMDKFDGNSGVYIGRVNAANMLDLGFSWKPSKSQNTVVALNINNLMDHRHAFFPLSSAMGRVALLKVMHTFGVK